MINLEALSKIPSMLSSPEFKSIDLKVEVDNRVLGAKSLFIAIKGEKFNPMEHLDIVVKSGCKFVLYEQGSEDGVDLAEFKNSLNFFKVSSINKAIAEIGKVVADAFKERGGQILAISGSNGKTTTKEMIFHLGLEILGPASVICTQKNNNNHLGVPFTLFQITNATKLAIIELGSNAESEIEFLCKILNPQFGITTNIGDTHLEFFETREKVFIEESILEKYCTKMFFKNNDDEYLKKLNPKVKTKSYGFDGEDFKFSKTKDGFFLEAHLLKNENITGNHNFINLAAAVLMLSEILKLDLEKILPAANKFLPTSNRSQWLKFNEMEVFLDAYNANPSSMKVAIEGFFDKIAPIEPEQVCLVLGDMNELGRRSDQMHEELGVFAANYPAHRYIFVGRFAENYLRGCAKKNTYAAPSVIEAQEMITKLPNSVKYLFIKGSRSLQLERILDIK